MKLTSGLPAETASHDTWTQDNNKNVDIFFCFLSSTPPSPLPVQVYTYRNSFAL